MERSLRSETAPPDSAAGPADRPAVVCDNLTVRYGDIVAADRVSFTADRGQVLGLLGPNGAGKTTVIRALTTVIEAQGGRATIAGADIRNPLAVRARIGVVPESSGYPEAVSGSDYVTYFARLYGLPAAAAEDRAMALLGRLGLADRAADTIHTYSRGMRQRLGIARALINRPEVLFLDEPTLGLDPAGKQQILALIRDIADEREAAVVLTSHELEDVEKVCDRVVIMHKARVLAAGSLDEVAGSAGAATSLTITYPATQSAAAEEVSSALGAGTADITASPGRIHVLLKGGSDSLAGDILKAFIDHGVTLGTVRLERASLADAFLALTRDDAAEPDA